MIRAVDADDLLEQTGQARDLALHERVMDREDAVHEIARDESTFVPAGSTHRLENPGEDPLVVIEVQCGDYLGEDDIERFDDRYGR